MNNETIGISAEVAIATEFGIYINPQYCERADERVVNLLKANIRIYLIIKKSLNQLSMLQKDKILWTLS